MARRFTADIRIETNPKEDLECRLTCPCCLGSKVTADFSTQYSCPWCFGKGNVVPYVHDLYWSVRCAAGVIVPRTAFGSRVSDETGNSKPRELKMYMQVSRPLTKDD